MARVVEEGDVLIVAYDYRAGTTTALTEDDRAAIAAVEGPEPPCLLAEAGGSPTKGTV